VSAVAQSRPLRVERSVGARARRSAGRIGAWLALSLGSVVMLVPFAWLLTSSLKTQTQMFRFPPVWIPDPIRWENYLEAMTILPFALYLRNTLLLVVLAEIGTLLSASLAAYGFARLRAPGRDVVFFAFLSTMMLPGVVLMIPSFVLFRTLGWVDTFLPFIVPTFFAGGPGGALYVFLLRQFFRSIPGELSDAARIDGASELTIFARIVLPLAKPALATVAIFVFLREWNDFIGPLIYLNSPDLRTISLGLAAFRGLYTTQWHYLMAASTATTLAPVLVFFAAQKYFIRGIVMSGLKA
jgi:ABC-type glycerol-3-phosphate transport system permease component